MDLSNLPEWCSELVREVGVPQLLSLPSATLARSCRCGEADVRQARHLLLTTARAALTAVPAAQLCDPPPLPLGCPRLDALLGGGVPKRGITELAGESGAGKTQICLQLALEAARATEQAVVYVCTEDAFPARRLEQLRTARKLGRDVTDRIFVEHVPDVAHLQSCCERRVPELAARRPVCALILDSVAAQFRCEYGAGEGVRRARHLRALGAALRRFSRKHRAAVLCVNQVTAVVREDEDGAEATAAPAAGHVTPALGLAWSSQLSTRLMVARTTFTLADGSGPRLLQLRVVSAPHLAPDTAYYQIWPQGVRGADVSEETPLVPLAD